MPTNTRARNGSGAISRTYMFLSGKWFYGLYAAKNADFFESRNFRN